ncbi:hypothetical protein BS78_09G049500 [Paspalum vaginatum]|nr:hypothetical protein BS78_09G049500 [Paspalum vaginatum]
MPPSPPFLCHPLALAFPDLARVRAPPRPPSLPRAFPQQRRPIFPPQTPRRRTFSPSPSTTLCNNPSAERFRTPSPLLRRCRPWASPCPMASPQPVLPVLAPQATAPPPRTTRPPIATAPTPLAMSPQPHATCPAAAPTPAQRCRPRAPSTQLYQPQRIAPTNYRPPHGLLRSPRPPPASIRAGCRHRPRSAPAAVTLLLLPALPATRPPRCSPPETPTSLLLQSPVDRPRPLTPLV